jgi:hypothetical protein
MPASAAPRSRRHFRHAVAEIIGTILPAAAGSCSLTASSGPFPLLKPDDEFDDED